MTLSILDIKMSPSWYFHMAIGIINWNTTAGLSGTLYPKVPQKYIVFDSVILLLGILRKMSGMPKCIHERVFANSII